MILPRHRPFERRQPTKDARVFIIFCEGKRYEPKYFAYFNAIDSRIKLEIIAAEQEGNNSPTGLYQRAEKLLIKTKENPNPEYILSDEDEIWFVIDTDKWGKKITELRQACEPHEWSIAQSNSCFELWLHYHFKSDLPNFEGMENTQNWKAYINNEVVKGGFDARKYPIFIQTAIQNAKANYTEIENIPNFGSTQVFQLAERFYPYIKDDIEAELEKLT